MIDDIGLREFDAANRARRLLFTLAAVSLAAAACADAAPPDDALASELSSGEVLALCDELRDAIQRDDRPIQCDRADEYWVLPSNQTCLSADLSACTVTVGQLRRCHELARQNPCSVPAPASPADLSPINPGTLFAECPSFEGCSPFVATTGYTYVPPECSRLGLASLQAFDGVYEVTGLTGSWGDRRCGALPELLEGTTHFVLVSTEASGLPEVILQSCDAVADCQALAREIQATGSPRGAEPVGAYNRLLACAAPGASDPVILQSVLPDVPSCELMTVPTVSVMMLNSPSLIVSISGMTDTEVSPGCGYIVPAVSAEFGAGCAQTNEFGAVFAAPLS